MTGKGRQPATSLSKFVNTMKVERMRASALALAGIVGCLTISTTVDGFLVRSPDSRATPSPSKPTINVKDAEILGKEAQGGLWTQVPSSAATTTTLGSSRYADELSRGRRSRYDGEINTWSRSEEDRRLRDLERAVERRLDKVERLEDKIEDTLDTLADVRERRRLTGGTTSRPYDIYRSGTDMGYYRRSVRDREGSDFYRGSSSYSNRYGSSRYDGDRDFDFRDTWSSVKGRPVIDRERSRMLERDRDRFDRDRFRASYRSSGFGDWSRARDRTRYGRSSLWDGRSSSWDGRAISGDSLSGSYYDRMGYRDGYGYGRDRDRYGRYGRSSSRLLDDYDDDRYDSTRYGSRYGRSRRDSSRRTAGSIRDSLSYSSVRDRDYLHQKDYGYFSSALRSGNVIRNIWEDSRPTIVQGGSLVTWSFANPDIEWIHVLLKSEGRPVDADVQLWHGPDNIPQRMQVYVEDALSGTFSAFIGTPKIPSTIAIRNTGSIEFPLDAVVGPDYDASFDCIDIIRDSRSDRIQGGAITTYPFGPQVGSVLVFIETDGRPLSARIELLQGPNHNKQVLDIYSEDGMYRPFMAVLQTPGAGATIRVVNTSPVEFPMTAIVEPYEEATEWGEDGIILGRSGSWRRR